MPRLVKSMHYNNYTRDFELTAIVICVYGPGLFLSREY